MAQKTIAELKSFFLTGLRPTQQNFHDWLDSFLHKSEGVLITSISADTNTGNVTINFTSGDPFVFNVTPQNISIANVQGLQDVLNTFVVSQAGYGLTQNNFTNAQVTALTTLTQYIDFLQNYNGGLSVNKIFLNIFQAIDTAGDLLEDVLSEQDPPFTISAGQILSVDYYALEPSDGSLALVKSNACFSLAVGTYGLDNMQVPYGSSFIDTYKNSTEERKVVLSDEYPLFDINAILNPNVNGGSYISKTQSFFNKVVYDRINSIFGEKQVLKGRDFTNGHQAAWYDNTPMSWTDGEIYRINTIANIDAADTGFNVIAQIDNVDSADSTIIRRFYLGFDKNGQGNALFTCWLEEAKSLTYYKQKSFETPIVGMTGGFFKLEAEVQILDIANNGFSCIITVGNQSFTLANSGITFTDFSGAYGFTNYPQTNRISWSNYYPAKVLLSYFYYQVNTIERNFTFAQKNGDTPYSKEGVQMVISPNPNNYFDYSGNTSLYAGLDNKIKSLVLTDLKPDLDTLEIDLSDRIVEPTIEVNFFIVQIIDGFLVIRMSLNLDTPAVDIYLTGLDPFMIPKEVLSFGMYYNTPVRFYSSVSGTYKLLNFRIEDDYSVYLGTLDGSTISDGTINEIIKIKL